MRVRLWRWLLSSALLLVLLVGCFQPAGRDLEPTGVDLVALTAFAPSSINQATITPFITPLPVEGFNPTPIPTTDPALQPSATDIAELPTDLPTALPTDLPTEVPPTVQPVAEITNTPAETATTELALPTLEPTPTTFLPPTPTAFPTENPCIHTVQPGEWLLKIARQYNVSDQILLAANPQLRGNPNALQVGDRLTIPNCNATPAAAAPPAVDPASVAAPTPIIPDVAPTPIVLTDRIYIVVEGDTLGAIARKFNITVQMLKEANALGSDFLRVGQELKIPAAQ
jgi:LysM repeat protein